MRILLVEDDTEAASYMVKAFREAGHVADHVGDGLEGLARARDETYDVLIIDRMLPKLDGLTVAVTLVVSSGVANAGFRVAGSFGKLWDSDYGDLLLKKIAIVAAMFALGYLNRFVLVPRLRTAKPKDMRQTMWLAYSLTFDIFLGALVLGASAVLGVTMPPQ
jgi:hypothetical protein